MSIFVVPQLKDNYAYVICDDASKECAVIDCADAEVVMDFIRSKNLRLTTILTTHWHLDHAGGNENLLIKDPHLKVFGGIAEEGRIFGLTHPVRGGEEIQIGNIVGQVLSIPAHTTGHVAYYFPAKKAVFTGDTLFIGGCGRIFEGSARTMLGSLEKLAELPSDTMVYCGHEYTEKNLRFALTLEPENRDLKKRHQWSQEMSRMGKPTVPSTIHDELLTNPFLRTKSHELIENLRKKFPDLAEDPVSVFEKTRALKDAF